MNFFNRCRLAILACALSVSAVATAGSQHDPTVEITTTTLVSPYFQDLTVPFTFTKVIHENYVPIQTTMTVTLAQDFRGKLVGQARFKTSKTSQQQVFDVRGKLKLKKATKKSPEPTITFSLNGMSATSATVSIKASAPIPPAVVLVQGDVADADLATTTTFLTDVKIRGTGRPYTYTQQVSVYGDSWVRFQPPTEEELLGVKEKSSFSYFILFAPFGEALAQGVTVKSQSEGGDPVVTFTLKAKKFLLVLTGQEVGGTFEPESLFAKLAHGKLAAPLTSVEE